MKNSFLLLLTLLSFSIFGQKIENRTAGSNDQKQIVENINLEKYMDFAPSISADGKTMIFESDRNKGWKLFETKLDESGNWSEPASISNINDFGRKNDLIAGPSISYDGNELYFFGFFMLMSESEDIFISNRTTEGWSEPTALPHPINTVKYEGFPSISSDGKTLFFIRVNEANPSVVDSLGVEEPCFEIWRAEKGEFGQWLEPEKLPAPINMGCERDPKIMADNETLLFSSIREGGRGLYDMYQTTLNEDGTWSNPISLDFVNTPENDQSPCISASGDIMYYYSNLDIYKVPIPPKYRQQKNITVEGYITGTNSSTLASQIVIKDQQSGEVFGEISNNPSDGWYSIVLTNGHHYALEYKSEGYLTSYQSFDLRDLEEYREEHVNVEMKDEIDLAGSILDEELKTPVVATITVRTLSGETVGTFAQIDNFKSKLKLGTEYLVSVGAENYHLLVDTILTKQLTTPTFEKEFLMKPKKVQFQMEVLDINNNTKVKSKLRFKNKNRNETIEANSDEFVSLRSGDRYEVESTSDGYFFGTTEIAVDELIAGPGGIFRTKEPIVIAPISVGSALVLKGITFDSNSSDLTESSQAELQRIIILMKANTNVVVEISAHTDDVGDAAYNLELSKQRAQSVVNYLTAHEVDIKNLVPVGYGMTRPAVPNDSDEHRAQNRRVEMSILKIN